MQKAAAFSVFSFVLMIILAACGSAAVPQSAEPEVGVPGEDAQVQANLAAVKTYAVEHVTQMKAATAALRQTAETYYALIEGANFDYEAAWAGRAEELTALVAQAKTQWLEANVHYELNEGIVAGVPSLAYYDTWLDAGPTGEEDPAEALDWRLELPDGRVLDRPGNFFHHLTEPAIWGTRAEFVGLAVDLNGDGAVAPGEALPEANLFLGAARGLDEATAELDTALAGWEPTLDDAFTALVTMIPTMNEYFEQWKLSAYVSGEASGQESFVAVSRLLDITGILTGLDVTYDNISGRVAQSDPQLNTQIDTGLNNLVTYVTELYEQEQGGKQFTPEDADLLGTKAQEDATALAGQVSQAAALLDIQIED